uniref:Rho-GAP domain-containing protein n=1 Tax=Glossina pallidipes TaxID=7398 RepID=A0A1A9ZEY1_GLOPL
METDSVAVKKDSSQQATLRRPVQIVKKRSGPLDEAIQQVDVSNFATNARKASTHTVVDATDMVKSTTKEPLKIRFSPRNTSAYSHRSNKRTSIKEKKRERWLFTRKTWKYMTDAGRKLIPDGAENRKEDIPKIEAHFQQVCSAEPRFILWRRKSSYPGALRSSKRRLKQLLQHTGQKYPSLREQEEANNMDAIIDLLHSHLGLDDSIKTTTLLGTKTVRPDQTCSPSAQRPASNKSSYISGNNVFNRTATLLKAPDQLQHSSHIDQLLERLRLLAQSSAWQRTICIRPEAITSDFLNDKLAMKKIYSALKKQQLHRILNVPAIPSKNQANLKHSSSLSSLLHFGNFQRSYSNRKGKEGAPKASTDSSTGAEPATLTAARQCTSLNDNASSSLSFRPSPENSTQMTKNSRGLKKKSTPTISCSTQTTFIALSEIKRLGAEYKDKKREQALLKGSVEDKCNQPRLRKSSLDNEDISQSVSDTIKRYLRMARKKSVQESPANQFKCINYDRNLRNIQAKGEINPPGMDEDNNKAIQTLDAWAVIMLDVIHGHECAETLEAAHREWQELLNERLQRKLQYEQNVLLTANSAYGSSLSSRSSSSVPTSPTSPPLSPTITSQTSSSSCSTSDVYSAISSSGTNVPLALTIADKTHSGNILHTSSQFLSNLWHSTTAFSSHTPSGIAATAETGGACINKNIASASMGSLSSNTDNKSHKRRILAKKKAMTTSLFDIGKKDYSSNTTIFGNSLESCVANDKIRDGLNLNVCSEKGSRNSIASLFRGGVVTDPLKFHDNVRSCESLPSNAPVESGGKTRSKTSSVSNYFGNLGKSASMQKSRSQTDMRRKSQELEKNTAEYSENHVRDYDEQCDLAKPELKVPKFMISCLNYLEKNGLHSVGLFRVSPSKKRVKQMRDELEKTGKKSFDDNTSPHDVATLLKEFLRDLPEPLLTNKLYTPLLETQKIRNRRLQMEAISHLVKLLPPAHRDTLYVLLRFLAKVAACSDDIPPSDNSQQGNGNKMDSNNLATVFAPNILRTTNPALGNNASSDEQEYMSDAINVVRIMIDHYEEIFKVPAELMDAVYSQMLDECPDQLYRICEFRSHVLQGEQQLHLSLSNTPDRTQELADAVKNRLCKQTVIPSTDSSKIREYLETYTNDFYGSESLQQAQVTGFDRRKSSPNVLHQQSGILSASLQIPMHLNYDEVFCHSVSDGIAETSNSNANCKKILMEKITNIPREESESEYLPISGSLSFTTRKDKSTVSSISDQKPIPPQRKDVKLHTRKQQLSASMNEVAKSSITSATIILNRDQNIRRHNNEPKPPASITNIGDAILRSKTADFERMSGTSLAKSRGTVTTTTATTTKRSQSGTSIANLASKTTSTLRSISSSSQQLYKRQELISSANNAIKK